ncbi:hypothetical protein GCM10010970_18600 [Silvimonas iriomotensis]|uniref:Prepilin-type N-terminal cleavage/methylation domain-containing protein n=1 Tax=Silvimonas iriomotensis TaxID=449662 RepID=A0ABQ2P8Q2_9NEIS|nr:hypothetical protein GCM10010970_18600 [Silvimonas iriomotensis]
MQRGFTLVEMMIVVLIVALFLLLGVPLTARWVGSANVNSATVSFTQGAAMVRSRALRNTGGVALSAPSAYLILINGNATATAGGTVCVQDATTVGGLNCDNAVWMARLPNGTSATFNGANAQCLALTPGGLITSATLGSTTCGATGVYAISTIQGVSGGPSALN